MKARALGSSSLEISPLCLGTSSFIPNPQQQQQVFRAALEAGIRCFDTAPLYLFGQAEQTLGSVLRDLDHPVQVFSKVGLRWDDSYGDALFEGRDPQGQPQVVRKDSRPEAILRDAEELLQRLQRDSVELLQIHHRDHLTPLDETMDAMSQLIDRGYCKAMGVSNFSPEDIRSCSNYLSKHSLASVQLKYNLLEREAEAEIVPLAQELGFGLLCYSPLAQGLLTGECGPSRRFALSDFRSTLPLFRKKNRKSVQKLLAEIVMPIAQAHRASFSQIAVAWLMEQNQVTSTLVGASTVLQAQSNARILEIELSAEELSTLSKAFSQLQLSGASPLGKAVQQVRNKVGKLRNQLKRV